MSVFHRAFAAFHQAGIQGRDQFGVSSKVSSEPVAPADNAAVATFT
jgi:hypothetical protein